MKSQSKILFWILLAATLAVDAVAISWVVRAGVLSRASILYDALCTAQLAIVCLWGAFTARHTWSAWIGAIAAVLAATLLAVQLDLFSFSDGCGAYGSFVALLAGTLWFLKRTPFWQRFTGMDPTPWQFSLVHLLAAMTATAVLIVSLQTSQFVELDWQFLTLLTVGDVLIVCATLIAWVLNWQLLSRLAAMCAAVVVLGAIEWSCLAIGLLGNDASALFEQTVIDLVAYATIIALIAFVWLELVPIVPHRGRAASLPPADADAS